MRQQHTVQIKVSNLLLILFLLLFSNQAMAQFCGKQTYSFKDGLNQPYIYSKIDSKGRLWVDSRGGGINMFDGKKWTNFKKGDEGLLYSWGTPILEDKEGGIWIIHSYEKGASRYINNKFTAYVMPNKNVDSLAAGQKPFPFVANTPFLRYNEIKDELVAWQRDSMGVPIMYPFNFETQRFSTNGIPFFDESVFEKGMVELKNGKTWLYLVNDNLGEYKVIYFTKDKELRIIDRDARVEIILEKEHTTPSTKHNFPLQVSSGKFAATYLKDGQAYLKNGVNTQKIPVPKLKQYGDQAKTLNLSFHNWAIHHYFVDQYSNKTIIGLWKVEDATFENGYVLAEYNTETWEIINSLLFFEDKSIGVITKDKAGTYWYCNGSSEVRLFPNQMWIPTGFQDMPSEAWAVGQTGDQKIWFGAYSKKLVRFDGTFIHDCNDKVLVNQEYMDGSISDEEGNLYFTTYKSGILKFDGEENYEFLANKKIGFYLSKNRKGELLFGSQKEGLWILPNNKDGKEQSDWKRIDQSKGLGLLNVITAVQDHQDRYWMGRGSQGMAIYLPQQDTVYNWINESNPNYGVQSMAVDKHGNMWLGTDEGLCFFDNQKHTITPDFDFKKQLQKVGFDYTGNSIVQVCKIYNDSTLIIGNGLGYFLINLNSWYQNPRQLGIQSFTENSGHQAGGIIQNGVWIDHNKDIWLTCSNGVIRHTPDLKTSFKEQIPTVSISQVFVGENEVTDLDKYHTTEPTQRNITLHFQTITNTDVLHDIHYRYRLKEKDKWSNLITTDHVNFYNLSPAEYNFEVIAERNGYRSKPAKFDFKIDKTFLQKPWIYLFFGLLTFIFGVIYSLNEKKLAANKKAITEITKEKETLQIQTIVNQLNPHFINNALQWLQIRLDRNEDSEAVRVVGKLSENISTVFRNSRAKKAFHPIDKELQMVQNYLFIQKIRFTNKFEYELPMTEEIEHQKDVHIPLLMLQIHVENAVEHGIRNKSVGGKITVTFTEEKQYVYFKVKDDGVGRKMAKQIGSHGTQNGLRMLEELMTIYNKQNDLKLTQEFIDDIYTDEHGTSFGTEVIIKIPKNYNYTI